MHESTATSPPQQPTAYVTLIRHAETRANVERVLQGIADAPLSRRGAKQVAHLEHAWRPRDGAPNTYGLPAPHIIVSSPIGRARHTAHAVARACGLAESDATTTHLSPPAAPPVAYPPHVLLDAGLCERNFGRRESTRRGARVPSFSVPHRVGHAETDRAFSARAEREGTKWLDWARARGSTSEPVHVVLVSHGQWINAFLTAHLPELRCGNWTYYIRSHNTALFTLAVCSDAPMLRLVLNNDSRHLIEQFANDVSQ